MFGKCQLKLAAPLLLLLTALSGCETTTYKQTPADAKDMSREQARELLISTVKGFNYWCDAVNVRVTDTKLKFKCRGNKNSVSKRFAEYPVLLAKKVYGVDCVSEPDMRHMCTYAWKGENGRSMARDFVRAWYVLNHAGPGPDQEVAFELVAKTYRDNPVKPELPEGTVRFKVQAEAAVREKRFDDAADLYEEALGIAPWWPAGHYNRGLILGELKEYDEAVDELKRYLKVDPDAANARAVQLKIYEWEGMIPKAAK